MTWNFSLRESVGFFVLFLFCLVFFQESFIITSEWNLISIAGKLIETTVKKELVDMNDHDIREELTRLSGKRDMCCWITSCYIKKHGDKICYSYKSSDWLSNKIPNKEWINICTGKENTPLICTAESSVHVLGIAPFMLFHSWLTVAASFWKAHISFSPESINC